MKNIHILPTDKPSRLILQTNGVLRLSEITFKGQIASGVTQNISITNDEEIKEGDYFWKPDCNMIFKAEYTPHKGCQKVILTTDQDLIIDGVQAIDDEFLEWFVKNPSCEEVEIANDLKYFNVDELRERHLKGLPHLYSESIGYKIIIPQEELKQETLEQIDQNNPITRGSTALVKQETLEEREPYWDLVDKKAEQNNTIDLDAYAKGVQDGAKWQQERSYSEEEVMAFGEFIFKNTLLAHSKGVKNLFEQFKKK